MVEKTRRRLGDVKLVDCGAPRQVCRSVSWNATGSFLAWASTDRTAKISALEGGTSREVTIISGHSAALDHVRFHPKESNWLCTAAQDRTIRLWDVRVSTTSARCTGKIDLISPSRFGTCPASVEWSSSKDNRKDSSLLIVAERNDSVHVYDLRKLSATAARNPAQPKCSSPAYSFQLNPVVESCHLSPSGDYLVAATRGEGMGALKIWEWQKREKEAKFHIYEGHTGPIYSHVFSPNGKKLATGGSDAIVGLWDVHSMVCTHTITRRQKFIRSVAFSHDSTLLGSSTEEDGIDLADASNGDLVGTISLSAGPSGVGNYKVRGGADEIAFHPKGHQNGYTLACARGDITGGNASVSPVVVAKISVSQ